MINFVTKLIPIAVLASHVLLVFVLLAYTFRKTWGAPIVRQIRENGILLGIALSLFIIFGSFYYSSVMGYPPCELCWWQRVFLFPTLILFAVAWRRGDGGVFGYVLPLAIIAGLVALYQVFAQSTGFSVLDCTAAGGACSKVYVKEFGYITIPVMGVTASLYLAFLSLINLRND